MKFSEAFAAEEANYRKGPLCSVAVILSRLDKEDAAALKVALESDTPNSFIVRALESIGQKVKAETVARHRRGGCNCG